VSAICSGRTLNLKVELSPDHADELDVAGATKTAQDQNRYPTGTLRRDTDRDQSDEDSDSERGGYPLGDLRFDF
jgi:hypothetical protein